ncbi:MAG: hypothetical protein ACI4DN_11935 [Lachnospiraceae bacterium]
MLFAKGIGLYDGQTVYKIFLLLAFACIGIKMCITRYSLGEWLVIAGLVGFSGLIYLNSGEKGILICMVTVVMMKNVSVKRAFETGLVVWSIALAGRFFTSLLFLENTQDAVQASKIVLGAVHRYFMGFSHPNVLHISYFALTAFLIYCLGDNYRLKHLFFLQVGNLFLFFYSFSFTGAIIIVFYTCLSYYVNRRKISRIEYILVELLFPACLIFSIAIPALAEGKLFTVLDRIFNNRINFAKQFLTPDRMTLLGNNLAEITDRILTMDNSFVFALVVYGVPVFLLICFGYFLLIHLYIKEEKKLELVMICSFFIAGITEPFLFNTSFKNLTLLFLGELLFISFEKINGEKKQIALLKNKDILFTMEVGKWKKAGRRLIRQWEQSGKAVSRISLATAILVTLWSIFGYRLPEYILKLDRDNLLLFERIRVALTAFLLTYCITAGILLMAVYGKNSFREKKEKENINNEQ